MASSNEISMICDLSASTFLPGEYPVRVFPADEFRLCTVAMEQYHACWRQCFRTQIKHDVVWQNACFYAMAYGVEAKATLCPGFTIEQLERKSYHGFAVATTRYVTSAGVVTVPSSTILSVEEVMTFPEHRKKKVAQSVLAALQIRLKEEAYRYLRLSCKPEMEEFYSKLHFKRQML